MTIMQLKYYIAVCNAGKVRIAAERLHVSEPALSISIKNLEDELGLELFSRVGKQLVLTEDGHLFKDRAAEVVAAFDQLLTEMSKNEKPTPLHIGLPVSLGEYLFKEFVQEFSEENPKIIFEALPLPTLKALEMLESGMLEIAICEKSMIQSRNIDFIPLKRSTLVGCAREDSPLANAPAVGPGDLQNEKLVLLPESSAPTNIVTAWGINQGHPLRAEVFSDDVYTTFQLVRDLGYTAFFFEEIAAHKSVDMTRLEPFTLEPSINLTYGLAIRKYSKLTRNALKFIDFCNERRLV